MTANALQRFIEYAIDAHCQHPTKASKAVRKWDGTTPYSVHPIWCATTLLAETAIPEVLRDRGSLALLLHDVLEDTTAGLPDGCPTEVEQLVKDMTFASSDEEMEQVWSRSDEVKLLKLFDKVSNLLDGAWMSPEKRAKYSAYTLRLAAEVEANFGELNIVRIAKAIAR